MRSMTLHRFLFLACAALAGALTTTSCGAGTAGISAGAGGSTTVQPAIAAFKVERPREPDQTQLSFTLSTDATVELGGSSGPTRRTGAGAGSGPERGSGPWWGDRGVKLTAGDGRRGRDPFAFVGSRREDLPVEMAFELEMRMSSAGAWPRRSSTGIRGACERGADAADRANRGSEGAPRPEHGLS